MGTNRNRTATAADTVIVTGPGCEGRAVPNVGCGISHAQYLAGQSNVDGAAWYVREDGTVQARVERQGNVIVTVAS